MDAGKRLPFTYPFSAARPHGTLCLPAVLLCGEPEARKRLLAAEELEHLKEADSLAAARDRDADRMHPRPHAVALRKLLHNLLERRRGPVRDIAEALGEITGMSLTEDIIDRIFEKFCLGK